MPWTDVYPADDLFPAADTYGVLVGAVNLLANTGFEWDSDSDGLADGLSTFGAPTTTRDTAVKRSGAASQKLVVAAGMVGDVRLAPVPVQALQPHVLSVWAWVSALSSGAVFVPKVEWLDSGGAIVGYDYGVASSTDSGFVRRTVVSTPPSGTVTGRAIFAVEGGGTVNLDEAQLEQGSAASDYTLPELDWAAQAVMTETDATGAGGAIGWYVDKAAIRPYEASFAAIGFAAGYRRHGVQKYADAAWNWCAWYRDHQESDGTMYDYDRSGSTLVKLTSRDSTDSYAGMYLLALRAANLVDPRSLTGYLTSIGKAVDAIELTLQSDGLTWAKPEFHAKYLMDQVEAVNGLRAAAVLGDAATRARATTMAAQMDAGIEALWNAATPVAPAYDWAKSDVGVRTVTTWSVLGDALQQAWSVVFRIGSQARWDGLMAEFLASQPSWADRAVTGRYDPLVAVALQRVGAASAATSGLSSIAAQAQAAARAWDYNPMKAAWWVLASWGADDLLALDAPVTTPPPPVVPSLPAAGPTTLAEAIVHPSRQPAVRVLVDWSRDGTFTGPHEDLSAWVESVRVSRSLATDMPEAVRWVTGNSAATAEVVLGSGGDRAASRLLSPFDAGSPLYSSRRVGAPVQIDLGFWTTSGPQFTAALRGVVESVGADGGARAAVIRCIDRWERVARAKVTLPAVVASDPASDRMPRLNAQWVMDFVLRAARFYATPPQRSGCVFSATMHGSLWPERSGNVSAAICAPLGLGNPRTWPQFTPGRFALAAYGATQPIRLHASLAGTASTNDGATVLMECWAYFPSSGASPLVRLRRASGADVPVELGRDSSNRLYVTWRRTDGGSPFTYATTVIPTGAWTYVACHLTFGATVQARLRVNATETATSVGSPSTTTAAALVEVNVVPTTQVRIEAVQVAVGAFTAWNDAFVPSAVLDPSLNYLSAMPPTVAESGATVLRALADAEQGMIHVDEEGVARFRNRTWLAAAAPTSTLSASTNLTGIASEESRATVRNRIVVPTIPRALQPLGYVWALSSSDDAELAAGSSTTFLAKLDGPAWTLDRDFAANPPAGTYGSAYRANREPDGTGANVGNLTVTVASVVTDVVKIVVSNPNPYTVHLVNGSGFPRPGQPALSLHGQVNRALALDQDGGDGGSAAYAAEAEDAASIALHDVQELALPENVWRQTSVRATQPLADALLAMLKDGRRLLAPLPALADPTLSLGDPVRVIDPDGLAVDATFRVTDADMEWSPSAATMTVAVREV